MQPPYLHYYYTHTARRFKHDMHILSKPPHTSSLDRKIIPTSTPAGVISSRYNIRQNQFPDAILISDQLIGHMGMQAFDITGSIQHSLR